MRRSYQWRTIAAIPKFKKDAKGEFFRLVAEQGHFSDRSKPTQTRQGMYISTALGKLLASKYTPDAGETLDLMKQALQEWDQQPVISTPKDIPESYEPDPQYSWKYPDPS